MPHLVRSEVISDPMIMGGAPVIRGTRIPAHLIAWMVSQGVSDEEILEHYPALNLTDIRAAIAYAKAHPEDDR